MKTKKLCQAAVMTAFVFVVTRFIQIPIPLGYFNVGNTVIIIGCMLMESPYGILFGSLGSALADLTSYPAYTIPTLIIKALMPLVFYAIMGKRKKTDLKMALAAAIATLIPLAGYTLTGGILYGNLYSGLAQLPGLLLEYGANLVLIILGGKAFKGFSGKL